ncbi:MAG TPA: response regulator transcription factor [Candidatus Caccenecus avistercoris]|nr:response regulator transcription factor [Candidatus Caccenecus avistercoris]
MKKILVVEDDVDIHNLIKNVLEKERYDVISAYSGTEALLLIEKKDLDLILLDLMIPGLSGEEIIKKVKNIPIIVISAKISSEDKVNALSIGANDYITKPFDTNELLARIKVQLRLSKKDNNVSLSYKDMILDKNSHTLYIKDKNINLTKTEYTILRQLLLNPKQIITKTKLIQLLNENDKINLETQVCDENSLKVHISNIRKKIKKVTEQQYIESVWGIGFKLYD